MLRWFVLAVVVNLTLSEDGVILLLRYAINSSLNPSIYIYIAQKIALREGWHPDCHLQRCVFWRNRIFSVGFGNSWPSTLCLQIALSSTNYIADFRGSI